MKNPCHCCILSSGLGVLSYYNSGCIQETPTGQNETPKISLFPFFLVMLFADPKNITPQPPHPPPPKKKKKILTPKFQTPKRPSLLPSLLYPSTHLAHSFSGYLLVELADSLNHSLLSAESTNTFSLKLTLGGGNVYKNDGCSLGIFEKH